MFTQDRFITSQFADFVPSPACRGFPFNNSPKDKDENFNDDTSAMKNGTKLEMYI